METLRWSVRGRVLVLALLAAFGLLAASCDSVEGGGADAGGGDEGATAATGDAAGSGTPGSGVQGTAGDSGASADGGVSAERLAQLEAEVAAAAEPPEFEAQGPAFSVADLAGRKIFSIPVASSVTGCDDMARWVVEIARSIGMEESFYFQNDGGPAAWREGMAQALDGGYDGVALVCGIDPNALTPQMQAARDAGIPVVDLHLSDTSVPAEPLIAGQTDGQFNRAMELGVYKALIASGGEPIDVFAITANENPPSVGMERTIYETFGKLCRACTVRSQNVAIPDWNGGAGRSTIDAALVAHPGLDAVFTAYDFMAPVVEASIEANGSDARIYGFGGDFAVVSTMTNPDSAVSSIMGPDFLWMAYSGADQLFRAMAGEDVIPADEAYAPYRLWTNENAGEKTEGPGSGFGDGFLSGYYDLWLDNPASEPFTP